MQICSFIWLACFQKKCLLKSSRTIYVKRICPCWHKSKHVALIWSVRFSKLCASEPFPSRRQPLVPSPTNRRMCDAKGNNLLYPFGHCWLHLYSLSSQCFFFCVEQHLHWRVLACPDFLIERTRQSTLLQGDKMIRTNLIHTGTALASVCQRDFDSSCQPPSWSHAQVAFVKRLLVKDPTQRPSAKETLSSLEKIEQVSEGVRIRRS